MLLPRQSNKSKKCCFQKKSAALDQRIIRSCPAPIRYDPSQLPFQDESFDCASRCSYIEGIMDKTGLLKPTMRKEHTMRNNMKVFSLLLLLALLMLTAFGCSYFSRPSDEEVIGAIKESSLLNPAEGGVTLQSPFVILERGKKNPDGSWVVKVKLTFTYVMSNGQTSKPMEKTPTFKIYKTGDNAGKTVWKAQVGV